MNENQTQTIAAIGLIVGGIFGMAGSFVPSPSLRGLAWGIDGVGLIVAGGLLTLYYFRKGYDALGAGFLVFAIGESLILSCSAINLYEDISSFAAGTSLWCASLLLISTRKLFPKFVRFTGIAAALLFAIESGLIFSGRSLNALTRPLPFYAYPFFAMTLFGWALTLLRKNPQPSSTLVHNARLPQQRFQNSAASLNHDELINK